MKALLNQLFEYKSLDAFQAKEVLLSIAQQKYNNSEVAAFMSVYLMRSLTVEELSGFRNALLELSLKVEFDFAERLDIVGTGGDEKNTFNISTLACFIVAGAGIKVTKHGNYGVSSISGSSNLLEAIGYRFSNDNNVLNTQLETSGLCFLHAPLFHPAMKSVAPIRKELAVRTFFNVLGPLVNPSNPNFQLIGVYNPEILRLYNYLLQGGNTQYSLVHSVDGYDEISLTGKFKCITNEKEVVYCPEDLNLKRVKPKDIHGGLSIRDSKKIFMDIINGKGTRSQNNVVLSNSAFAIQTVRKNKTFQECFEMAAESLRSKKALFTLNQLIKN